MVWTEWIRVIGRIEVGLVGLIGWMNQEGRKGIRETKKVSVDR